MKLRATFFLCSVVLITLLSGGAQAAVKSKSKIITIQTSAICEICKKRIEAALKSTDGVEEANLNLNSKKVKVKYNPLMLSENQIKLVIVNTGYDADDLKKDDAAYNKLPHCCQKP